MGRIEGQEERQLLRAAELANYDAFVTVDQGIPFQQHSGGRQLSIVVIRSRTNQMEDLLPLVKSILLALETIRPGEVVAIPTPG